MALTNEQAEEHKNDYAVTCCRLEAGAEVKPSHIEDPNILPDLEDSGLVDIPDNCLTVGQVLGRKLVKTVGALTPLTPDLVDGVNEIFERSLKEKEEVEKAVVRESTGDKTAVIAANQFIRIHIGKGKDINLEIPVSTGASTLS